MRPAFAPPPAAAGLFLLAAAVFAQESEEPHYWQSAQARAVVVVAGGLNVKPSKMGSPEAEGTLVKLLLDSGCSVYRVTLAGHAGPLEGMKTVTTGQWLSGAYTQYCQALREAENAKVPLILAGFSLGALVYETLLQDERLSPPVRFEKAILFAPALAIRKRARAALRIPFTNGRTIIPSAAPADYRAQRGASVAAYQAVFQLEEQLYHSAFTHANIETIVFIDPQDEFLSLPALRETLSAYSLTRWRVHEVSADGAAVRPRYHHLIIDKHCVPEPTWQHIISVITDFLAP